MTLDSTLIKFISLIHEFGIPIKRELLKRYLDCDWEEFIEEILLGAASRVVIEDYQTLSGMAFYRTKHPAIAKVVREHTVRDPVSILTNLLDALQPGDIDERFVIREILKNEETLHIIVPEINDRRRLFAKAIEVLPDDLVIRHQLGLDEMDAGNLENARRIFEVCLDLDEDNRAIVHSLGMLEWQAARQRPIGPVRELHFTNAERYFERVCELDSHSEYGYHSKAAMFMERARTSRTEDERFDLLASALEFVEEGLRESEQGEGSRLADLRGQLFQEFGHFEAAREQFNESIASGTATPRTYWLLAKLEFESGWDNRGDDLVRAGLEHHAGNRELLALRAERALQLRLSRAELVDILQPAVLANPNSLILTFELAASLYMLGRTAEAHRHFRTTRRLSEGVFQRGRPRKRFFDGDGNDIKFTGRIERTPRTNLLRVVRTDNGDAVYFNMERALAHRIGYGARVTFRIAFSFLGTLALDLGLQDRPGR